MRIGTPRFPVWAALVGNGLAGALIAVQSRLNGGLSRHIDNAYLTAALSFVGGLLILGVALTVSRTGRTGFGRVYTELRGGTLPLWAISGGLCGAVFVLSQGMIATVIGLAVFTVAVVAGQVLGGIIMDRFGVGPSGRVPLTLPRVLGTVLVLCAVLCSVLLPIFEHHADPVKVSGSSMRASWLILIPLIAGVGVAFQIAANGLVRVTARSALTATCVSFCVGTVVLVIAAALSIAAHGWSQHWPAQPWYYLGGVIGVVFVAATTVFVRTAGVLLTGISSVAGQLLAGVALEAGVPLGGGVNLGMLIGAAVGLLAVTVTALPGKTRNSTHSVK